MEVGRQLLNALDANESRDTASSWLGKIFDVLEEALCNKGEPRGVAGHNERIPRDRPPDP